jgi:hypothetical protein
LRIVQVDAFTARAFAGNPAAVCVLPAPAPVDWMQPVAAEMNLAETAFLVRRGDAFDLRWFTPAIEVDLCGHATLASAHVLWQDGHLAPDADARFDTRSGRLTARRAGDWIEMDFPAEPADPDPAPPGLLMHYARAWAGRARGSTTASWRWPRGIGATRGAGFPRAGAGGPGRDRHGPRVVRRRRFRLAVLRPRHGRR